MKKGILVPSILTMAWMAVLPWLSRLPRGTAWTAQYLPDAGLEAGGLLFMLAFFVLPAIPLVIALARDGGARPSFWLGLATATTLSILVHSTLDLAADAQAAIGMIMAPAMICGVTWALEALAHFVLKWASARASARS